MIFSMMGVSRHFSRILLLCFKIRAGGARAGEVAHHRGSGNVHGLKVYRDHRTLEQPPSYVAYVSENAEAPVFAAVMVVQLVLVSVEVPQALVPMA